MALLFGSSGVGVFACVHPPQPDVQHANDARSDAPKITITDGALRLALNDARVRLAQHGLEIRRPTNVIVSPDMRVFADDIRGHGGTVNALTRAYTVFDTIWLAPLDAWADGSAPSQVARLSHELCHAAIEQAFGTQDRAARARIPRFFEEGACSVVARQQPARLPFSDRRLRSRQAPIDSRTFDADPDVAYAAAHHLMAFVVEGSPDALGEILRRASGDAQPGCVERAFVDVVHMSPQQAWTQLQARADVPT